MAPRYTILIADDYPGLRELVHMTIASDDYLVLEAATVTKPGRFCRTCRPDVALLDVQMPRRDGLHRPAPFAATRSWHRPG